jgi:hypothetical protein
MKENKGEFYKFVVKVLIGSLFFQITNVAGILTCPATIFADTIPGIYGGNQAKS